MGIFDVESRGRIDAVEPGPGDLVAHGCACSLDAGPLTGLDLRLDDEPRPEARAEVGLPSPFAAATWGYVPHTENAGFRVRTGLDGEPSSDRLVTLVPRFGDHRGVPLFQVLSSSLPVPPEDYQTGVGGFFFPVAFEFLSHCIVRAGLERDASVLDVGCGVGRMAFPMTAYLSAKGRYEGFDVLSEWIDWAQQNISSRFPRFRFRHIDVANGLYHPVGALQADAFVFPYAARSFDFVLATSVFTHLRAAACSRYLSEIARVLKPGGVCLATWFLVNEESSALVESGRAKLALRHPLPDGGRTSNLERPEDALGYEESWVDHLYASEGLEQKKKLLGGWCYRRGSVSFQDILIARRSV